VITRGNNNKPSTPIRKKKSEDEVEALRTIANPVIVVNPTAHLYSVPTPTQRYNKKENTNSPYDICFAF
jgi:hypothetical protein